MLVYGENERIDALGAGAPRSAAGLWRFWSLEHRVQLQAYGGPELAVRVAIAGPDATALRTRLGVRARSLLAASIAPVLADK